MNVYHNFYSMGFSCTRLDGALTMYALIHRSRERQRIRSPLRRTPTDIESGRHRIPSASPIRDRPGGGRFLGASRPPSYEFRGRHLSGVRRPSRLASRLSDFGRAPQAACRMPPSPKASPPRPSMRGRRSGSRIPATGLEASRPDWEATTIVLARPREDASPSAPPQAPRARKT